MRMALDQAQAAADAGEVPVGAILVDPASGEVISTGANGPIAAHDGTSVNDTNDQSTKNIPTIVKMNSGVSFNAANVLIARVPSLTPNAFNASSKIYTDASTSTRVEPEPTDGKNFAS